MKNNRQFTVSVASGRYLGIIVGQLAGSGLMHCCDNQIHPESGHCFLCASYHYRVHCPSITRLGNNASKVLGVAIIIAYVSSIGAALFL